MSKNDISTSQESGGKKKKPFFKAAALALAFAVMASVAYNSGAEAKLNKLIADEAAAASADLQRQYDALSGEIDDLSRQREGLNGKIASMSDAQASMKEQAEKKADYTARITQLSSEIQGLDSDILQAQSELAEKEAAKKKAAEEEARLLRESSQEMVWIGATGTKYHRKDCRTLRGTKRQITLEQALAQGRAACKVCH